VSFSRGLFGKSANPAHIEKVLKDLSLWDTQGQPDHDALRRHEAPAADREGAVARAAESSFLDEPTAGVDVELRRDMWNLVRALRDSGVTVILTTHYIDEAEEMADRIGVISKGEIILVDDKAELMRKLGRKQLTLQLQAPLAAIPPSLARHRLELGNGGTELTYTYETGASATGITALLDELDSAGVRFKDLSTTQSSLEDIFVSLVRDGR
jgi:ABC-2 type transport system ATP-binding protein